MRVRVSPRGQGRDGRSEQSHLAIRTAGHRPREGAASGSNHVTALSANGRLVFFFLCRVHAFRGPKDRRGRKASPTLCPERNATNTG